MTTMFYIPLVTIVLVFSFGTHAYNDILHERPEDLRMCAVGRRKLVKVTVTSQLPPRVNGVWTSDRCEVRPGPEFLMRKYEFSRRKFTLHQYYYKDPDCNQLSHGVIAHGTFRTLGQSWIVAGGVEGKYRLRNVSVIPYTEDVAEKLARISSRACQELRGHAWYPFESVTIMNFPYYRHRKRMFNHFETDFDCTGMLNLSFHELQLFRKEITRTTRLVRRKMGPKSVTYLKKYRKGRELFLGDVHTVMAERESYRPTGYQPPLRSGKDKRCAVCNDLLNSNDFYPPELRGSRSSYFDLNGSWVSSRCETRQYGQFLTRVLTFDVHKQTWSGRIHFFDQPDCTKPTFSINAHGTILRSVDSSVVDGAKNVDFRLERMKITPRSYQMVETLNTYGGNTCGNSRVWDINVENDITGSRGCSVLGIALPAIEYELFRIESSGKHLYLLTGQVRTDGWKYSVKTRPTSFQTPLIKCNKPLPGI